MTFSWGDPVDERDLEELNRDFQVMGVPLKVTYEETDDNFDLIFTKQSLDSMQR